jgi:hypothetical protein
MGCGKGSGKVKPFLMPFLHYVAGKVPFAAALATANLEPIRRGGLGALRR